MCHHLEPPGELPFDQERGRKDATLRIRDVMTRDIYSIGLEHSISFAVQKMRETNAECLVVVNGRVVTGVITGRDMALGCLVDGHDPSCVIG